MIFDKDPSQRIRYFERALLAGIALLCLHSAYGLFWSSSSTPQRNTTPEAARGPASAAALEETMETLDLGCLPESAQLRTGATRVRLKARLCDEAAALPAVNATPAPREPAAVVEDNMIENPSTGYKATVYLERRAGELTTEFIPLRHGENKVLLSLRRGKGALKQHHITVVQTK